METSTKDNSNYYKRLLDFKGDSGENLIAILERRLDAIVYRSKFVPTVFAARQFINHGHVKVNGKRLILQAVFLKKVMLSKSKINLKRWH